MKERPILFSAPMVRAILNGTKTQTRRLVKPAHKAWIDMPVTHQLGEWDKRPLPYGKTGDRLFVREACIAEELPDGLDGVGYLADEAFIPIQSTSEAADRWLDLRFYGKRPSAVAPVKTVPAIHMPRWASRITLEVTGVRVERLQDISEADAIAEGVSPDHLVRMDDDCAGFNRIGPVRGDSFPIARYAILFESINGIGSWEANPLVWVVEFKRVEQTA